MEQTRSDDRIVSGTFSLNRARGVSFVHPFENSRIVNLPRVKCAREPPTADVKAIFAGYSPLGPSSFFG